VTINPLWPGGVLSMKPGSKNFIQLFSKLLNFRYPYRLFLRTSISKSSCAEEVQKSALSDMLETAMNRSDQYEHNQEIVRRIKQLPFRNPWRIQQVNL
jgi:hypothetical protein